MDNVDQIRTRLEGRKSQLTELLSRVERHARRRFDKSLEEQAIQRENEEVFTHIDDSLNLELAQIEEAILRLDRGIYGKCENCGEAIASKRLEALPHTHLCINCAS
ncbi:MAG TPA: TraR/DksA family transcriptional regulator [Pyrinomonadaceae bacterium]|nr:TraR/DksA family transcriptional regulator [Pyrinomonadaceae bacterium]